MNVYQEDERGTRDAAPLVLFYHFSKTHATPHGCNRVWNRLEDNEDNEDNEDDGEKRSEQELILVFVYATQPTLFWKVSFNPVLSYPTKLNH